MWLQSHEEGVLGFMDESHFMHSRVVIDVTSMLCFITFTPLT